MEVEEIKEHIRKGSGSLESLASPGIRFLDGTGVMHWAAFFGNTKLARLLAENKADLDSLGGKYLSTPLFFAMYNRNYHIAYIFIKRKAPGARKLQLFKTS